MNDDAPEPGYSNDDLVDEAGRESFPASDPPSFSPGVSYSKSAHPAGEQGQYHASISRHKLQPSPAIRRCCNIQSVAPWGLFLAATVAGIAVGGLLARSYMTRT